VCVCARARRAGGVAAASVEAVAANNDRILSELPARLQYAAASAIERSADAGAPPPSILWLARPCLLPYARRVLATWLVATVAFAIILGSNSSGGDGGRLSSPEPQAAPILLLLLPILYNLLFWLALRSLRGVVFALTDSAALVLELTPALSCCGVTLPPQRTSYLQMTTPSTSRSKAQWTRWLFCASAAEDVQFASKASLMNPARASASGGVRLVVGESPRGAPLRFHALAAPVCARAVELLAQQQSLARHQGGGAASGLSVNTLSASASALGAGGGGAGAAGDVIEAVTVLPPVEAEVEMLELRGVVVPEQPQPAHEPAASATHDTHAERGAGGGVHSRVDV
jgi:hypothetical protein